MWGTNMGVLETVFSSREFDLNDDVLVELTDCKQIEHLIILYWDWWTVNAWFYGGKECGLNEWTFELP